MDRRLSKAVENNQVDEVCALLTTRSPRVKVNSAVCGCGSDGERDEAMTVLHIACQAGHVEVVEVLLTHPEIDVNSQDSSQWTPLLHACASGRVEVAKLLLLDERVDVNACDYQGRSALWWLAYLDDLVMAEWIVASGWDLKLGGVRGRVFSAIEVSRNIWKTSQVEKLLLRVADNPALACHEVRLKLGVLEANAADLFALVVFLCEGLLVVSNKRNKGRGKGRGKGHGQGQPRYVAIATSTAAAARSAMGKAGSAMGKAGPSKTAIQTPSTTATATATGISWGPERFFGILQVLPMELQMVVCFRTFGLMKDTIVSNVSEAAFRRTARWILLQHHTSKRKTL